MIVYPGANVRPQLSVEESDFSKIKDDDDLKLVSNNNDLWSFKLIDDSSATDVCREENAEVMVDEEFARSIEMEPMVRLYINATFQLIRGIYIIIVSIV